MSYWYGSVPIMYYPIAAESNPLPPTGLFLLTDGTNLLLTDGTPLMLAGP